MEEPGNLDLEFSTTNGIPRAGQSGYVAPYLEMEYGVTARWTSELYLEGQSTSGDSTVFTGWRWENRYKVLGREHWINPVLYLEYESLNEASRIQKEIEGGGPDLTSPNALLTSAHGHELEGKLILSSDYHDWNISENFILAKNFSQSEGIEFGYAFGISRPLATLASARDCHFCRENFSLGAEVYGGLGSTLEFGPRDQPAPGLDEHIDDDRLGSERQLLVAQHQVDEAGIGHGRRQVRNGGRQEHHGGIASGRESGLVSGHKPRRARYKLDARHCVIKTQSGAQAGQGRSSHGRMCATRAPNNIEALPKSEGDLLERFRSALVEARELMRRAERAARRRQWREAAEQIKQSQAELDRAQYELIREMRAENLSWPAIGRELGERNWEAVYQRFQRLERRFGQPPPADEPPEPQA